MLRDKSIKLSLLNLSIRQAGQLVQALVVYSHADPVVHTVSADTLIELDAGFVPLENNPVKSSSVNGKDLLGQCAQQLLAITLAALRFSDVQVLKVDACARAPRAIVVEVQRHAYGLAFR